uniref:Coiled-coil domain-containing protein 25 n=1 Tax=Canis lupus familiaris TaxID=9615 RepID=A0A8C0PGD0_CANLF
MVLSYSKNHPFWGISIVSTSWHLVSHSCRAFHVYLASPADNCLWRQSLCFYTPYDAWHVVSTELILSGLECFKCKGPEEMLVLYLLLKVVFILCRFHVDKLSSAHVYLRLHKGEKIEDIPKEVLMDCAHLVKANSIQGAIHH